MAVVCFGLGLWVGMTTNATLAAWLWGAAALAALLPFVTHRDHL